MATPAHLAELEQRHRMLEDQLAEALQHPSTDDFTLAELKRRKLQLKDEMVRLTIREWRKRPLTPGRSNFPKPPALDIEAGGFVSGPGAWRASCGHDERIEIAFICRRGVAGGMLAGGARRPSPPIRPAR